MARSWRIRYKGAIYHVSVRGNGRQDIFLSDGDRDRFMEQLKDALEKDGVVLYAFVLMSNHYHLLIQTPNSNIQRFMQRLNTAYATYFRYKRHRPGHCFQGRYKAKLVGGDDYILRLTRYIHLNPIKIEAMRSVAYEDKIKELMLFNYSSYPGYISKERECGFVNYRLLRLMHRATNTRCRTAYASYIEQMVGLDDQHMIERLQASKYAIGDEDFCEEMDESLKSVKVNKGVYGDIIWPEGRKIGIDQIEGVVARECGTDVSDMHGRSRKARLAKSFAVELCCRYAGVSQREVAKHYGYTNDSTIGKQRNLLARIIATDSVVEGRFDRLKDVLSTFLV